MFQLLSKAEHIPEKPHPQRRFASQGWVTVQLIRDELVDHFLKPQQMQLKGRNATLDRSTVQ
jgi:hypothetical protein